MNRFIRLLSVLSILIFLACSRSVLAQPVRLEINVQGNSTVTFSNIAIRTRSSVASASLPRLRIRAQNFPGSWQVSAYSQGLKHDSGDYWIRGLYINPRGTIDGSPVIIEGENRLDRSPVIIYGPAPSQGNFFFNPTGDGITLRIEPGDNVLAGTYRGSLRFSISSLP